jgi:hypothetical protein
MYNDLKVQSQVSGIANTEDKGQENEIPADVGTSVVQRSTTNHASLAQKSGRKRFKSLRRELSAASTDSMSSASSSSALSDSSAQIATLTEEQLVAQDLKIVEDELNRYLDEGVLDDKSNDAEAIDPVIYWEVRYSRVLPLTMIHLTFNPFI